MWGSVRVIFLSVCDGLGEPVLKRSRAWSRDSGRGEGKVEQNVLVMYCECVVSLRRVDPRDFHCRTGFVPFISSTITVPRKALSFYYSRVRWLLVRTNRKSLLCVWCCSLKGFFRCLWQRSRAGRGSSHGGGRVTAMCYRLRLLKSHKHVDSVCIITLVAGGGGDRCFVGLSTYCWSHICRR